MVDRERTPRAGRQVSTEFLRSLPLFVAAALFAVFGAVVLRFDPHYGPGAFTLWALLFVLATVCAIGGIASWLLVEDPRAPTSVRPKRGARRVPRATEVPLGATHPYVSGRFAYGRPAPYVLRRASTAPLPSRRITAAAAPRRQRFDWEEDDSEEAGTASPVVPHPDLDPPSEVLRDLDGIEQELTARPRGQRADARTAA